MKKTAGFLKFFATLAIILLVLALVACVLGEGVLLTSGDLSSLQGSVEGFITINSTEEIPFTVAQLNELKPALLFAVAFAAIILLLSLLSMIKIRKVLGECKEETPFSEVSCRNLKGAARLEIIAGIIGIIATIVSTFLLRLDVTINGKTLTDTTINLNLSFIFTAVFLYLLYHVAQYGKSLENGSPEKYE